MKLRIRPATPADVPAMMVLEKQSVTAAHWSAAQYNEIFSAVSRRVPTSTALSGRRCVSGIASETAQRFTLVIAGKAGLQGFLVARVLGKEWELENIVVAEQVQRRGLGTRLLAELVELAQGQTAHSIWLEVRESNRAARSLYEKCCFVERGHRKRYYHGPEERAIVYRLDLA